MNSKLLKNKFQIFSHIGYPKIGVLFDFRKILKQFDKDKAKKPLYRFLQEDKKNVISYILKGEKVKFEKKHLFGFEKSLGNKYFLCFVT